MKKILFAGLMMFAAGIVQAQVCRNNTDTIYGLNSITGSGSGQIVGINVNNAGTSLVGSPPASSNNANGAGFSPVTGLFYFFNQCSAGTTEFISYNPITNSKVIKTIPSGPALPTTSAGKIRTGTVTRQGTGYYTLFPGASTGLGYPSTNPAFYYYSIGGNTWTLITQNFKDVSGNIVTPIRTLNSGDMAFDGQDNLWLLCASSAQYALYRIKAPLPTSALAAGAAVIVDTMIPVTSTPGGVSFTGIAFNASGKLYLSTGSYTTFPGVAGNNQLYSLASTTAPLVTIGTLPNGYGDDLTSCSFPPGVLTSHWISCRASYDAGAAAVNIGWKINEDEQSTGYEIEYSNDGASWQIIAAIARDAATTGPKQYQYTHYGPGTGPHYYRIAELSASGRQSYSATTMTDTHDRDKIYPGPNPVKDILYFYNRNNSTRQVVHIYDKTGRMVYAVIMAQGQQSLDIGHLSKGMYILTFLSEALVEDRSKAFKFVKW